jgi:hypothetical protein
MAPSEFDEKKSLAELLDEARRELAACKAIGQELVRKRQESWEELAGREAVLAMQEDRKLAERYLEHPNRDYRLAALEILRDHWKTGRQSAATWERLLDTDEDVVVRGAAATALGSLFESTNDRRIGRLLARIVEDASQPEGLRTSAYLALRELVEGWEVATQYMLTLPIGAGLPDDLDWSLVSRFSDAAPANNPRE